MVTIVWDRDDVLNDLMRNWLEQWWIPTHPGCRVAYEKLKENPPHRILGVSREEYLLSLDQFRLSKYGEAMRPLPEMIAWFNKYGDNFSHIVLSATPLDTAPVSASWTFSHFGSWVRSFHVIPAVRDERPIAEYERDKGFYLKWLGKGDVLVDDSPTNLEAARRHDIAGVLIPRPWNDGRGTTGDALDRLLEKLRKLASS